LLTDIFFLDSQHGWAVGLDGQIVSTENGGLNWEEEIVCSSILCSVEFTSLSRGYVVGQSGIALQTSDGGLSWSECPDVGMADFWDIEFIDAAHGWIAGVNSWEFNTVFYYTENGGESWESLIPEGSMACYAIQFSDYLTGYAFGSGNVMLKTTDGGENWSEHAIECDSWIKGISIRGNGAGWAVGSAGRMLHTTDGWETSEAFSQSCDDSFYDVAFADQENGWAVGHNISRNLKVFCKTTDGGDTWERNERTDYGRIKTVSVVSDQVVWMAGTDGEIVRSIDGGLTWDNLTQNQSDNYTDSYFFNELSGWIVGHEVIMRTTDGGDSWERNTSGNIYGLQAIDFVNENTGWIVSESGTVLRTTDGGENWDSMNLGLPWVMLYDAAFINEQRGWILGFDMYEYAAAILFSTIDGGETWEEQLVSTEMGFRSIEFCDSENGLIVGDGGMLSTTDGGETWIEEPSLSSSTLKGIAFAGNEVWVAGYGGTILHKDGVVNAPPVESPSIPVVFAINAYPNPFNPETTIRITLNQPERIQLSVYDVTGRLVERIMEGAMPAGIHHFSFNAGDLPSGVYFAQVRGVSRMSTARLVVVK